MARKATKRSAKPVPKKKSAKRKAPAKARAKRAVPKKPAAPPVHDRPWLRRFVAAVAGYVHG